MRACKPAEGAHLGVKDSVRKLVGVECRAKEVGNAPLDKRLGQNLVDGRPVLRVALQTLRG